MKPIALNPGNQPRRQGNVAARCLLTAAACGLLHLAAWGQAPEHPLKPPDRSSPRAALRTFLESGDAVGALLAQDYLLSPSRATYQRLFSRVTATTDALDLSAMPAAARTKIGRAAALALYETLNRIELPPWEDIPDEAQWAESAGTNDMYWLIPNTEIALKRVSSGLHRGEFLFSPETVARAADFSKRVKGLPYTRAVPLEHMKEAITSGYVGWMIPSRWIRALPQVLHRPLAEQAAWKWLALALVLALFALLLRASYRLSHRVSASHPFLRALAQASLPVFLILATPVFAYFTLVQIGFIGKVGGTMEQASNAVMFLAGAWTCWRLAPVFAEGIIASPQIATESINAHLIRICARLLGIVGSVLMLVIGAERIGVPLYGIMAGLGVGGVALALAAQPSIENLIGGFSLFADKPIRVGDFCRYGTDVGIVEAIGLRSTRIRGIDRTLTTIPNAVLARMPVVNFAMRDRMLLKTDIGLRYETQPEQLRFVLAKLRELLLAHPRVTPEPARVRFIGFGNSSLNVEVFAYVSTEDWNEFLAIQEDILLRMMDVVTASGTGIAFPSQTLYFARDSGLDPDKSAAALAQVQAWRAEQKLPFPEFDLDFRRTHRDTLDYPPTGSPKAV
jgi:MscS family membrane protein